jgi:glycosyltransferase involved in cell wall biosynthesis
MAHGIVDLVIVVDDASQDETAAVALGQLPQKRELRLQRTSSTRQAFISTGLHSL